MNIQGQGALITGASRGLGRALAEALAARGARVAMVAREPGPLDDAVATIRARGGIAHAIAGDIARQGRDPPIAGQAAGRSSATSASRSTTRARSAPRRCGSCSTPSARTSRRVLETNLVGPFRLTKVLAGAMALRGAGVLVHISSDAAVEPYPRWGAYGVSKAAQDHLSRILAAELDETGVRVLAVDPGEMDTRDARGRDPRGGSRDAAAAGRRGGDDRRDDRGRGSCAEWCAAVGANVEGRMRFARWTSRAALPSSRSSDSVLSGSAVSGAASGMNRGCQRLEPPRTPRTPRRSWGRGSSGHRTKLQLCGLRDSAVLSSGTRPDDTRPVGRSPKLSLFLGVLGALGGSPSGTRTVSVAEYRRSLAARCALGRRQRQPTLHAFASLPTLLRSGDLVIVNDAATLPASLRATTASGEPFELRLSGPVEANRLRGVLLGAGDHRIKTEDRPAPPPLTVGDRIWLGFAAIVVAIRGRSVEIATRLDEDALWQALYEAGAPVQYAYRPELVPLYAVQTAYASRPWSVEMPSAGRPLTWEVLLGLRRAGIELASVTHAAGLSSTGDDAIDRALPLPERYEIPRRTVAAIAATRARGGRVIAIGTTVVRALEAARSTASFSQDRVSRRCGSNPVRGCRSSMVW